jgi:hypothetical protein
MCGRATEHALLQGDRRRGEGRYHKGPALQAKGGPMATGSVGREAPTTKGVSILYCLLFSSPVLLTEWAEHG